MGDSLRTHGRLTLGREGKGREKEGKGFRRPSSSSSSPTNARESGDVLACLGIPDGIGGGWDA